MTRHSIRVALTCTLVAAASCTAGPKQPGVSTTTRVTTSGARQPEVVLESVWLSTTTDRTDDDGLVHVCFGGVLAGTGNTVQCSKLTVEGIDVQQASTVQRLDGTMAPTANGSVVGRFDDSRGVFIATRLRTNAPWIEVEHRPALTVPPEQTCPTQAGSMSALAAVLSGPEASSVPYRLVAVHRDSLLTIDPGPTDFAWLCAHGIDPAKVTLRSLTRPS